MYNSECLRQNILRTVEQTNEEEFMRTQHMTAYMSTDLIRLKTPHSCKKYTHTVDLFCGERPRPFPPNKTATLSSPHFTKNRSDMPHHPNSQVPQSENISTVRRCAARYQLDSGHSAQRWPCLAENSRAQLLQRLREPFSSRSLAVLSSFFLFAPRLLLLLCLLVAMVLQLHPAHYPLRRAPWSTRSSPTEDLC